MVENPSRGRRRFYALSYTTSPGGKHRGLAGSVAVLIAESLLMFNSLYIRRVTNTRSNFSLRPLVQLVAVALEEGLRLASWLRFHLFQQTLDLPMHETGNDTHHANHLAKPVAG